VEAKLPYQEVDPEMETEHRYPSGEGPLPTGMECLALYTACAIAG
jgi:hypothetical protein